MAAQEDQLEAIVWLLRRRRFESQHLASIHGVTAQTIDTPPPRNGVQPASRIGRDTMCPPLLERLHERILNELFGKIEVAQDAHKPHSEPASLLVEDGSDNRV